MQKWEYMIIEAREYSAIGANGRRLDNPKPLVAFINDAGQHGWELVNSWGPGGRTIKSLNIRGGSGGGGGSGDHDDTSWAQMLIFKRPMEEG